VNLRDAARVGVYLADAGDSEVMDAVYREHFHEPFPARTTVTVGLQGIRVEIDAAVTVGGTS
jgi:2-iminobutanoate/2-iminopropanoate deaminase